MSTDRVIEFEGPCKCGKGKITITHCSPDHGWPTSTPFWHTTSLDCNSCSAEYEISQVGANFILKYLHGNKEQNEIIYVAKKA